MARRRDERGAGLVEFAIALPVLLVLLLGMFSGGVAYSRKITITDAAREAGRFGATLPVASAGSLDAWLDRVAGVAAASAGDEVGPTVAGRRLCVAYVHPDGTDAADRTRMRLETESGTSYGDGSCYADGRSASERRVQVVIGRPTDLDAFVYQRTIDLRTTATARFEAAR